MPVGDAVSLQQLRKSSITVMRHMLASMKTRLKFAGETSFSISIYSMGRQKRAEGEREVAVSDADDWRK